MGFAAYTEDVTVDCVLEGTGHPAALAKCLESVRSGGRVLLMGNPVGDMTMTQKTYWHILRKELTVLGTWNSSYNERENDWQEALNAMASGKLQVKPLITHRFPLEKVNDAFEMMKNRTEFFNKVMITMEDQNDK